MTSGGLTKGQAAALQTFSTPDEECIEMYESMARECRREGVDDMADWFDEIAKEARAQFCKGDGSNG